MVESLHFSLSSSAIFLGSLPSSFMIIASGVLSSSGIFSVFMFSFEYALNANIVRFTVLKCGIDSYIFCIFCLISSIFIRRKVVTSNALKYDVQ
ncbi:hypothetical protein D3C78_1614180 [compost metagenome]